MATAAEGQGDDRAAIDEEKAKLRSVEDMQADGVEDEEGQQLLDFGDQLNLSVKGKKPTDSEIKIKAISMPIKGQLGDVGDDEVVSLLVTARLDDLHFPKKRDGDGHVIAKKRRHIFTPISVYPVSQEQADALLEQPED